MEGGRIRRPYFGLTVNWKKKINSFLPYIFFFLKNYGLVPVTVQLKFNFFFVGSVIWFLLSALSIAWPNNFSVKSECQYNIIWFRFRWRLNFFGKLWFNSGCDTTKSLSFFFGFRLVFGFLLWFQQSAKSTYIMSM